MLGCLVLSLGITLYALVPSRGIQRAGGTANSAATHGSADLDNILSSIAALKRDGQFEKAQVIVRKAIEAFPHQAQPYIEHAEVLIALGKPGEAYANYSRALQETAPTSALHLAAGTAASMANEHAAAREHFAKSQQLDPRDWKAPLFLAQVQLKLHETEQAKKNLLLCVNIRPEAAVAWGTLADIALRENKLALASQYVARARTLEPRTALWSIIEARVLKRDNKPREAAALLLALEPQDRYSNKVLSTLSECYGLLRQPHDAALLYATASDAQPGHGDVAMEAAQWFLRAQKPEAALRYARRAADLNQPGAADLLISLDQPK